ncbi:hypothetical protein ZIOFF_012253 [Zingiber officinale]|uniref:G3BP-like protein n=1 Tax=Zingiber officinale TaxID=94328 RepID=A0A8J5I7M5_ZINOF|nr:hypothetical protein ZIOFF_012253 [Zingiber officinale]
MLDRGFRFLSIAKAFAIEYYHLLTRTPEFVFRFYKEGSMLSRPDPRGEMTSVIGMDVRCLVHLSTDWVSSVWCLVNDGKAINEELLSVDYSEYDAVIKTLDAQESLDGSVTILVTGYLTGNDGVKKNFTQSFFLATQETGYYVLNDIFRLLDEANDQPSVSAWTSGDSEPLAPEPGIILDYKVACSLNPQLEQEKLDEAETIDPSAEISCSVKEEVQAGKGIDEISKSLQAVTLNPSSSTTLEESPPSKSYTSIVNIMKENPTPPVSLPVPSKPAVVSIGQPASPTSIPALVIENASGSPNTTDSYSSPEPEAVGYSIHLRNLPLNVTPEQLHEEFKKFGPIKPGGIQVKLLKQNGICFGFVHFEVADAVARAIEPATEACTEMRGLDGGEVLVELKVSRKGCLRAFMGLKILEVISEGCLEASIGLEIPNEVNSKLSLKEVDSMSEQRRMTYWSKLGVLCVLRDTVEGMEKRNL